jgi:hypothetical protein
MSRRAPMVPNNALRSARPYSTKHLYNVDPPVLFTYVAPTRSMYVRKNTIFVPDFTFQGTAYTATMWFKYAGNAPSRLLFFMQNKDFGVSQSVHFSLDPSSNVLNHSYWSNDYKVNYAETVGVWAHYTFTSDAEGNRKTYVNGAEVVAGATYTGGGSGPFLGPSGPVVLARGEDGSWDVDDALVGNISSVTLWNVQLTDAQVLAVYNDGAPVDIWTLAQSEGLTGHLKAWLPFDGSLATPVDTVAGLSSATAYRYFDSYNPLDGVSYLRTLQSPVGITISFWWRPYAVSSIRTMVSFGSHSGQADGTQRWIRANNTNLEVSTYGGTAAVYAAGFNTSTTYHIVWVNPDAMGEIFVNGVSIGSLTDTPASAVNNGYMHVGSTGGTHPATGHFSCMSVFTTTSVTQDDVDELYNGGVMMDSTQHSTLAAHLESWWLLQDDLLDRSGNGNDLENVGTAAFNGFAFASAFDRYDVDVPGGGS